jgi:23S rRNA maturation-related 3'-5' exoribonuclease YhaM
VSAIAELAEERVVEGVYAVARKQRMRTKGGAPYLALELVDPSGRIDARVWHDVELLDARFTEGDAVRVLGRVEKFRDRLQVDVRTLEAAPEADPADFAPAMRRDAEELDGFLEFLAAEIVHPGLAAVVQRFFSDDSMRASLRRLPAAETHHSYAGGLLEHTVGVATICRELCQLHPRLRADLLLAAALLHDLGRTVELAPGPGFRQTAEGRLLERYMQAWQASDLDGFIALLREDATFRMPPWREWYQGRAAIRGLFETVWRRFGGFRTVAVGANAQPAVGVYARSHHDPAWRAHSLHVIEPAEGGITDLTVYLGPLGPRLFPAFGLPPA